MNEATKEDIRDVHGRIDELVKNQIDKENFNRLVSKVDELIDDDHRVTVEWCYKKNDEDMYEVGQDYAHMVRITFLFLEVEEVL